MGQVSKVVQKVLSLKRFSWFNPRYILKNASLHLNGVLNS